MSLLPIRGIGAAIVTCVVLASCTSVPITSYPKLASLDPEVMPLEDIELAVRMQDDFGVIEDSAVLSVGLVHEGTGETFQREFILEENPEPLTSVLERKLKSGYVIRRFKMSDATAEDATQYRAMIVAERDAEPGDQHEGTFSARVGFCMEPGGNPFLDPRMTLFLKTAPDQSFFTMIKETKMPIPRDQKEQAIPCAPE
ncbi:MAG: hypothetical protein AAF296_01350 [Pseudomonadota bacterium]